MSHPFLLIAIGVVVLGIVGVIVYSSIRNVKVNKYGEQVVAQKEQQLKEKREAERQAEEQKASEPVKTEPKKEEPVKVEPKKEEPKKVEPVKAEPKKEEPKKEEPKKEVKKAEPKKEEPAPVKNDKADKNKSDDQIEKEAEKLLKDIPDAADNKEERAQTPAPVEKKAEEPAPVAKKTAAKKSAQKKTEGTYVPTPFVGTKKAASKKADSTKKSNGKWMLIPDTDGYYFGKLYASNGEMIMQTERYKGIVGLKSGIDTIIKNVEKDNFDITVDKYGKANYKLFASNHSLLCIGEGYSSKETAENTTNSVKNFVYSDQIVSEEAEPIETKEYSINEDEKSENGKWIVVDDQDGYFHLELKANNGQVLLVSEQYKGINSLKSGLDSIRKNVATGNFSSKQDKNENYNFKLYSENKRLLALGAGYSTFASCESAIYSVMKFNDSVVVFPGDDNDDNND